MLRLTPSFKVYIALGPTDLRNNIDGLSLMVERQFNLDPFYNSLFVFCNRKKDKIKILFWDKCGSPLHEMKEEVRVEIEVIPAKVQITLLSKQLNHL